MVELDETTDLMAIPRLLAVEDTTMLRLSSSLFMLCLAGCVAQPASQDAAPTLSEQELADRDALRATPIVDYAIDRSCQGANYDAARHQVDILLRKANEDELSPVEVMHQFTLSDRRDAATALLKIAVAAANKNCHDQARQLYLEVINTFVGSGYAAYRQRAQIGLDDLRVATVKNGRKA